MSNEIKSYFKFLLFNIAFISLHHAKLDETIASVCAL